MRQAVVEHIMVRVKLPLVLVVGDDIGRRRGGAETAGCF
jgi:hypothetical protein